MPPYHKNSKVMILDCLFWSGEDYVLQRNVTESIGISRQSVIPAVKDLLEREAVQVKWAEGGWKMLRLDPRFRKASVAAVNLLFSRVKKSKGIFTPIKIDDLYTYQDIKALSQQDLNSIFLGKFSGVSYIHKITPTLFREFIFYTTEKIFSLSVMLGDAEGVATIAVEDLISQGLKITFQPKEAPEVVDTSFINNRVREQTRQDLGFFEGCKRSYSFPPPDAGSGKSDWEIILKRSEIAFFSYYVGLHPAARDLLMSAEIMKHFVRVQHVNPESGFGAMFKNAKWADMVRSQYWKAVRRARVMADFFGAPYPDFVEIVGLWFEKYPMRDDKGKLQPLTPLYFGGPVAMKAFELGWPERERIDRLDRYDAETLDPDFLPENYTGTEKQNLYFGKVMQEGLRLATAQGLIGSRAGRVINRYIDERILPKEFAEGPLNTVLPGYVYEKPTSFVDALGKR